ncbi:lipoprotein LpqH [Mycobacterium tilburgii]|uniref:lipoprotein LpqH n=1 Tax=Mycobacterium tilburgii TaxID=44467 RepID=UPI0011835092|nr:lipoprotein LpqH [Mycobacterium tilburgii]
MTKPDARRRRTPRVAGLGTVVLVIGLSGCSSDGGSPAAPTSSTPALSKTTVMMDQHSHTITAPVDCKTSAAAPHATPPESGDLTTRINVHDDSASVSLALSDEKPPSVDGFAVALKVGSGQYQLPYQPTQSANQVLVTKDGRSYTVTGSGQGTAPGQSGMRQITFGIHVTCP